MFGPPGRLSHDLDAKNDVVSLRSLHSMSMDSTWFDEVFGVAIRVFDGEQSVLHTRVHKTLKPMYPRYWVTYLGYRSDLYLGPCLWYWSIEHGRFQNTPVFMVI
jgi:hypothetical protein